MRGSTTTLEEIQMPSLTYWYCKCLGDSDSYSIIAKTKKAALAKLERGGPNWTEDFAPPEKRVIQYRDAFDLFYWCTSEGGGRSCGSLK
jgi:hypothetical protein